MNEELINETMVTEEATQNEVSINDAELCETDEAVSEYGTADDDDTTSGIGAAIAIIGGLAVAGGVGLYFGCKRLKQNLDAQISGEKEIKTAAGRHIVGFCKVSKENREIRKEKRQAKKEAKAAAKAAKEAEKSESKPVKIEIVKELKEKIKK